MGQAPTDRGKCAAGGGEGVVTGADDEGAAGYPKTRNGSSGPRGKHQIGCFGSGGKGKGRESGELIGCCWFATLTWLVNGTDETVY